MNDPAQPSDGAAAPAARSLAQIVRAGIRWSYLLIAAVASVAVADRAAPWLLVGGLAVICATTVWASVVRSDVNRGEILRSGLGIGLGLLVGPAVDALSSLF